MSSADCIFCKIASGQIPAQKVHESDDVIVFRDISPKAPTHLLAIPKRHVKGLAELHGLESGLFEAIAKAAAVEKIAAGGFRVVLNQGADAGQEVEHLHFHILGGRPLSWPPG